MSHIGIWFTSVCSCIWWCQWRQHGWHCYRKPGSKYRRDTDKVLLVFFTSANIGIFYLQRYFYQFMKDLNAYVFFVRELFNQSLFAALWRIFSNRSFLCIYTVSLACFSYRTTEKQEKEAYFDWIFIFASLSRWLLPFSLSLSSGFLCIFVTYFILLMLRSSCWSFDVSYIFHAMNHNRRRQNHPNIIKIFPPTSTISFASQSIHDILLIS